MSLAIQKYVDEVQDICIEKKVRDRSSLEVNFIVEDYVDNLYDKGIVESNNMCAVFDAIMANIDYEYIEDAISEHKYTNLQKLGLSERDFL